MIAKLAYLTSPAPDRFILNYQEEGKEGIERVEISKAHLANIIISGTAMALRESIHRVPSDQTKGRKDVERTSERA